jgi:argininosuccinate lyase
MRGAEFNVQRLAALASEGGTTLTELADHLVRQHGIPFRTAHGIAAGLLKALRQQPMAPLGSTLAAVSANLLGAPLEYSDAQIEQVMSPRHFVEVRRTLGGPSPEETARAIGESRQALEADREWLARTRAALEGADTRLRERSAAL